VSQISLVRQPGIQVSENDKEAARRVLFGVIDGLGDTGRRQWRRFFNALMRMEPGEIVEIQTHKERSLPFHRRHMLIEQRVFDQQERFESWDQFRCWIKVASGFVDWCAGPKGGVIPVPKSISFSQLEDGEMREVHEAMIAFLRGPHAANYLWPHLKGQKASEMMNSILEEFGE
jgi:hypothetical protein